MRSYSVRVAEEQADRQSGELFKDVVFIAAFAVAVVALFALFV